MQSIRKLVVLSALTAVLAVLAVPASAGQMFMASTSASAELKECDTLHHEQSCQRYHVVKVEEPAETVLTSTGTIVQLDDSHYRVDWMGLGYRLDNGTVIARSSDGLGESWVQVFPHQAPVEVANWSDVDGSSYLTVGDSVTVGGSQATIDDHRLYLWITPID